MAEGEAEAEKIRVLAAKLRYEIDISNGDGKPKAKEHRQPKEPKAKKVSCLDAAAQILADATQPMNCQELIDAMVTKGLWSSPKGKTPAATLYSAILRELATKGSASRFTKTERGKFAFHGK